MLCTTATLPPCIAQARKIAHPADRLVRNFDALLGQVARRYAEAPGKLQPAEPPPHLGHLGFNVALLSDPRVALLLASHERVGFRGRRAAVKIRVKIKKVEQKMRQVRSMVAGSVCGEEGVSYKVGVSGDVVVRDQKWNNM